jgi:plastocyanin
MPRMTTARARIGLGVLLVGAAAALVACGSDDSGTADTSPPADLEVTAGPGLTFGKDAFEAPAGTISVRLTDRDTQRHTLTFVRGDGTVVPGGELDVNKSGATDSGEYTFEPGTYKMICTVPGHESMKATLTVK